MSEATSEEENPFDGPRLKIARARAHTQEHWDKMTAFSEGFSIQTVNDLVTNGVVEIIHDLGGPFPEDVRLAAADALYNLRSALDQAISRCTMLNGSTRKSYFPHGSTKDHFEKSMANLCPDVADVIKEELRRREPYLGGTGYLFEALHILNLADKHNELVKLEPRPTNVERHITLEPGGNRAERRRLERMQSRGKSFSTKITAPIKDDNYSLETALIFPAMENINLLSTVVTLQEMAVQCEDLVGELERLMSATPYRERWPKRQSQITRIYVDPLAYTSVSVPVGGKMLTKRWDDGKGPAPVMNIAPQARPKT